MDLHSNIAQIPTYDSKMIPEALSNKLYNMKIEFIADKKSIQKKVE